MKYLKKNKYHHTKHIWDCFTSHSQIYTVSQKKWPPKYAKISPKIKNYLTII